MLCLRCFKFFFFVFYILFWLVYFFEFFSWLFVCLLVPTVLFVGIGLDLFRLDGCLHIIACVKHYPQMILDGLLERLNLNNQAKPRSKLIKTASMSN